MGAHRYAGSISLLAGALAAASLAGGCGSDTTDPGSNTEPDTSERSEGVTSCPNAGTVEGVDVSEHNGTISWSQVANTSVRFAWIKASQGTAYVDPRFTANWSGAKAAKVLRGAYHFFDPTVSGVTQANHYLDTIGTLGAGDLPPALDLECPDGNPQCLGYPGGDGWAPSNLIAQRALDFLTTVHQATGKKPVVYTYSAWFAGAGVSAANFSGYTLWQAMVAPSDGCFTVAGSWKKWTFWQYSWHGSVAGIPTEVDRNKFNGTLATLLDFASGGGGPPPGGSCPYGNGLYCGGNAVGGNPLKLYQCNSGDLTTVETCALGCERMPIGVSDQCAEGGDCPYGNGDYCGGNGVGGDPEVLYTCDSGTLKKKTSCSGGCVYMPIGYNDVCD